MKYYHVHSKSDTEFEFDKDLLNNNHIHSTFFPKSPEETSLNEFERKKSSYSNQYPKRKPSHANTQKKRRSILTNQYILQRPLDNYENYFANLLITIIKLKKHYDNELLDKVLSRQKSLLNTLLDLIREYLKQIKQKYSDLSSDTAAEICEKFTKLDFAVYSMICIKPEECYDEIRVLLLDEFILRRSELTDVLTRNSDLDELQRCSKIISSISQTVLFLVSKISYLIDYYSLIMNSLMNKFREQLILLLDSNSLENEKFLSPCLKNQKLKILHIIDHIIVLDKEFAESFYGNEKDVTELSMFSSFGRFIFGNITKVISQCVKLQVNNNNKYNNNCNSKDMFKLDTIITNKNNKKYNNNIKNNINFQLFKSLYIKAKYKLDKNLKLYFNVRLIMWKGNSIKVLNEKKKEEVCRICELKIQVNEFYRHIHYCKEQKAFYNQMKYLNIMTNSTLNEFDTLINSIYNNDKVYHKYNAFFHKMECFSFLFVDEIEFKPKEKFKQLIKLYLYEKNLSLDYYEMHPQKFKILFSLIYLTFYIYNWNKVTKTPIKEIAKIFGEILHCLMKKLLAVKFILSMNATRTKSNIVSSNLRKVNKSNTEQLKNKLNLIHQQYTPKKGMKRNKPKKKRNYHRKQTIEQLNYEDYVNLNSEKDETDIMNIRRTFSFQENEKKKEKLQVLDKTALTNEFNYSPLSLRLSRQNSVQSSEEEENYSWNKDLLKSFEFKHEHKRSYIIKSRTKLHQRFNFSNSPSSFTRDAYKSLLDEINDSGVHLLEISMNKESKQEQKKSLFNTKLIPNKRATPKQIHFEPSSEFNNNNNNNIHLIHKPNMTASFQENDSEIDEDEQIEGVFISDNEDTNEKQVTFGKSHPIIIPAPNKSSFKSNKSFKYDQYTLNINTVNSDYSDDDNNDDSKSSDGDDNILDAQDDSSELNLLFKDLYQCIVSDNINANTTEASIITDDIDDTSSSFYSENHDNNNMILFNPSILKQLSSNNKSVNDNNLVPKNYMLNVNTVSINDFTFLIPLAKGGYGRVDIYKKKSTGDLYAIKTVDISQMKQRELSSSLTTETIILNDINSEYVVKCYFIFNDSINYYYVMEFMAGGDLLGLLNEFEISEKTIQLIIKEVVLAIEYLHSLNIIHKDIKPENILISTNGHFKVTDFGLSESDVRYNKYSLLDIGENNVLFLDKYKENKIVGTLNYMAPELFMNDNEISSYFITGYEVDFWALGVLLFELHANQLPFYDPDKQITKQKIINNDINWSCIINDNIKEKYPNVDKAIDLIKKLLVINPEQRWGDHNIQQIKAHSFFNGINWDNNTNKTLPNPEVITYVQKKLVNVNTKIKQSTKAKVSLKVQNKCTTNNTLNNNNNNNNYISEELFQCTRIDNLYRKSKDAINTQLKLKNWRLNEDNMDSLLEDLKK